MVKEITSNGVSGNNNKANKPRPIILEDIAYLFLFFSFLSNNKNGLSSFAHKQP